MEKSEKEILDLIVAEINKGELIKDIAIKHGINYHKVSAYLKLLDSVVSPYYNPDLYKEIVKKKRENANREISGQNTYFHQKLFDVSGMMDAILKWHLSLEETSKRYNKTEEEILNYIANYHMDDDKKEKVMQLFERRKEYPTLKLFNLPTKVQEEVALMALTYRLNPDDLMLLFKTGPDDIDLFIRKQAILSRALYHLKAEASYATKEERQIAFESAKNYWLMRNKLIKRLNEADKDNIKEYLQEKLEEHRSLIDDTLAREAANKNARDLTQEEKDAIAQIRVKYGFCTTQQRTEYYRLMRLNPNLSFLNQCADCVNDYELDLAKRDEHFARRLNFLRNRTELVKNVALESRRK